MELLSFRNAASIAIRCVIIHRNVNLAELYNTVQRAYILCDDEIELRAAGGYGLDLSEGCDVDEPPVTFREGMSLSQVEREVILETVRRCRSNKTKAAAVLGVSVKTLYNRLNAYGALD